MTTPLDAKQPATRRSWQLPIKLKRDPKRPPSTSEVYDVEVSLDNPASDGMSSPVSGEAAFDLEKLTQLRDNLDLYGKTLGECLFKDGPIRERYQSAVEEARVAGVDLRVIIFIDPSAPELHAVLWELLAAPKSHARIANNQATPFSRFIYARDLPEIPALRKENVRALIAVPNPTDIESSGTSKISVLENIRLAAAALQGLQVRVMCKPHGPDPSKSAIDQEQADLAAALQDLKATVIPTAVTLDNLVDAISDGVDLLYLVCHGHVIIPTDQSQAENFEKYLQDSEDPKADSVIATQRHIGSPVLWLEKDDTDRELVAVPGGELALKIKQLAQRPGIRLAVLASCESAGAEHDTSGVSAHAALAPRLAQAGVPTIVAMQGKISMETAATFMESLLANVACHGSIDRAVAAARGKVSNHTDCWMPALFSRLKSGSLWYEAGFRAEANCDIQGIADQLAAGICTPFVGWGLAEKIYGSKANISKRLAVEKLVPFTQHRKGELALVSQYLLTTTRSDLTAGKNLMESMRAQMLATFKDRLPLSNNPDDKKFNSIGAIARFLYSAAKTTQPDPFEKEVESLRIVARLPATVFINACPDKLLEEALRAEGKDPIVRVPHWKTGPPNGVAETLSPSINNPLLFHIFGRFAEPQSLVLCEDDFLDYLMGIAQYQNILPNAVKNALTNQTLMFLGFNLDDWSFRVLFRVVTKLMAGGSARQAGKPNVAVQVEPDGTLFAGPEEANFYLEKFYAPSNIEPFWGTSADFLTELYPKVKAGICEGGSNDD